MSKILSGISASGQPSLGNYIGAFKPHMNMQQSSDVTYFIADLHAITVRQDPQIFQQNAYIIAAWYIACGLDVHKTTLFVQSHVFAHAQLAWILNCFTMMGELERMTQFKDKSARHKQNINAGLFTYPALQAADILLYHPTHVPVGEDQVQHIEITRDIASRFNNLYGEVFTLPEVMVPKVGARVKNLQEPTKKMSKSEEGKGTLFMLDAPKTMAKKIKSAVTDNEARIAYDTVNQPGVANLLEIYASLTGKSVEAAVAHFEGQQYGTFKAEIADVVVDVLEPIQNRYKELMADKAELDRLLKIGADKASCQANNTLEKVMEKVGFMPPLRG